MPNNKFLTIKEISEITGLSIQGIHYWIKVKKFFPVLNTGKRYLINKNEFEKWWNKEGKDYVR